MFMIDFKITKKYTVLSFSLILVLLIVAVYAKSINFAPVNHDDYRLTLRLNDAFRSKSVVKDIFSKTVFMDDAIPFYRPLMTFSFYIDNCISGGKTSFLVNHFTNIMLHILFVLLFFYFLRTYCFDIAIAFFASAVFAVHFIAVDTVAWISGRNDSLLALFVLAAFLFFIRYNENQTNRGLNLFLHCFFCFAALLTKESAAAIPVICFVYTAIKKYSLKGNMLVFLLWAVIISIFLLLRYDASGNKVFWNQLTNISLLKSNIYMVCDYFSASFGLSKIELYPEMKAGTFIKGIFVVSALAVGSCFSKNRKLASFYLFFAMIFLLSNFFINRTFFQGNRMYLPLAGVVVCVFYVFEEIFKSKKSKRIIVALILLVLLALTFKAAKRVEIYENEYSFVRELKMSSNNPNILAKYIRMWSAYGFYERAVHHLELEENIKTNKEYVKILLDMYLVTEQYEKAAKLLEDTEEIFVNKQRCYEIIMFCYEKTGNAERAGEYKNRLDEFLKTAAEDK